MRESGDPRSRSSSLASIASRTGFGRRNVSSSDSLSKYTYICMYIYIRNTALVYKGKRRGRVGGSGVWISLFIDFHRSWPSAGFLFFFFFHVFFFFFCLFFAQQRLTWEISGNTSRRIPIVRLLLRASLLSASISINRLRSWKKFFSLLCRPHKPFSPY